ncbi:hypothetical protein BX600DRAFT_510667 [Xylariales sp. PMI_506]|nr:hypothetical protein BX600DRAFT_510667 [Xylariales sp. PMI_506]
MERLRPGDVSPAVESPDDYRGAHDISPMSPVEVHKAPQFAITDGIVQSLDGGKGSWSPLEDDDSLSPMPDSDGRSPVSNTSNSPSAWRKSLPSRHVVSRNTPNYVHGEYLNLPVSRAASLNSQGTRSGMPPANSGNEAEGYGSSNYSPVTPVVSMMETPLGAGFQEVTGNGVEAYMLHYDSWQSEPVNHGARISAASNQIPYDPDHRTQQPPGEAGVIETSPPVLGQPSYQMQDCNVPSTSYQGPELEYELRRRSLSNNTTGSRSTVASTAETKNDIPMQYMFWEPVWFRDLSLTALTIMFAIVAIVILVVYIVSSEKSGFGSYSSMVGVIYLWKFIPTAGKVLHMV